MMKIGEFIKKIPLILAILVISLPIYSQSGMKWAEFTKKLETYFDPVLIQDITAELGKSDFSVWSWDVGDFSDDTHNDVAFAIRKAGNKDKKMEVYMFADIDGYLVKVAQQTYEFVELPLEVGVAFRYGVLYVTQKFKQFHWKIDGFKLVGGSLVYYDKYTTKRIGKLTHDNYENYYTLRNMERYQITSTGASVFFSDFYTIPSYRRNRFIYNGITDNAFINDIAFCHEGAYWWQGDDDFSYYASSAYDDEYLYFTVLVKDDNVVQPYNNIENGEQLDLWLDVTDYDSKNDRFAEVKGDEVVFKSDIKNNDISNIFHIKILVGDFVNKEPTMSITSKNGIMAINENVVVDLTDNGYYVMFKIPFSALNRDAAPLKSDDFVKWGATIRVWDIDNEFKPNQCTLLQSSNWVMDKKASFGDVVFIPDGKWYGETHNIFQKKILNVLENMGY